jgi:hypothetical protein
VVVIVVGSSRSVLELEAVARAIEFYKKCEWLDILHRGGYI